MHSFRPARPLAPLFAGLVLATMPLLHCGASSDESLGNASSAQVVASAIPVHPSGSTSMCLGVSGGVRADGQAVVSAACTGGADQRWTYARGALVVFGNQCLDASNGGAVAGTALETWSCTHDDASQQWVRLGQLWQLANYDLCMQVASDSGAYGTAVKLAACDASDPSQVWSDAGNGYRGTPASPVTPASPGTSTGTTPTVPTPTPTNPTTPTDPSDPPTTSPTDPTTTPTTPTTPTNPTTPTTPTAPSTDLGQICIDTVNAYRATLSLPALSRNASKESCVNEEAQLDSEANKAHSSFGHCSEFGQCECPGYDGDPSKLATTLKGCLAQMWAEGPGGGHYDIMTSTSYKSAACGYYITPDNKLWATQSYFF